MNTIHFVLPADRHLPSGGNIYNERLTSALQDCGLTVQIMDFATYRQALQQDRPGWYGVDSLFVKDMQDLLTLRPQRAKSFFILHHLESLYPPPGVPAEQLFHQHEQAVLSFFQGFLVSSSFAAHYLRSRGLQQPVIRVEPATDAVKRVTAPGTTQVRALMVANLTARKGVLPWLQQLQQLTTSEEQYTLTIVGRTDLEPAYAQACRQFADSSPVLKERVHFTGPVAFSSMGSCYGKANLFVSAAYMETFGMALQEAATYGLPLLALSGGYTNNHIRQGVNGYIFNSTAEMANFFIDLVKDRYSFSRLAAKAALALPPACSWREAAGSFIQQFNDFFKTL